MEMYNPPHPGRILKEALESVPMTVADFAAHIGVSRVTLSRIVNCHAGFTPEMSLRVSEALGQGSSGIWFRMQNAHDFWQASAPNARRFAPSGSTPPRQLSHAYLGAHS
jgi:addiction module HigA family antidote